MFFIYNSIKKLLFIIDKGLIVFIPLLLLFFISGLLDLLSLGMIAPYINFIIEPEIINESKFENYNSWEKENFQRNLIMEGINKAQPDDYILISDLDEIPNPKKLQNIYKHKYSVFNQSVFYYKFNLKNISETNWYGTRCCKKKYLISPQKLRNEKIKNYPFWRLDKIYKKKFNIIEDGGWHFTYIKTLSDIKKNKLLQDLQTE